MDRHGLLLRVAHAMSVVAAMSLSIAVGFVEAAPPTERLPIHVAPEDVRIEFERMAEQLPYLSLDSVVYDRDEDDFQFQDPAIHKLHYRILDKIAAPRFTTEALVGLLSHADSKVRTLAIAALFDRADPRVLPHVLRLDRDDAQTFPSYHTGAGAIAIAPMQLIKVEQTVFMFARRYANRYVEPHQFAKYWQERKDRATCAGWFQIDMQRATQGIHPIRDERRPQVEAVLKRVEQLPGDDATWTLLYLYGEYGKGICSEEEMLDRCRKLGREKILLALQRKLPSNDPDLKQGYRRGPLHFLLGHATELLLPSDVELLLECERNDAKTPDFPFSGTSPHTDWFLAAVDLRPDRAGEFVRAGMKRFDKTYQASERRRLAERLWELAGETEQTFVVDWFFGEHEDTSLHPDPRESFLQRTFDDKSPEFRRLMARLVSDPRLEKLDPLAMCELGTTVNKWTQEPVIGHADAEEFRRDARLRGSRFAARDYPMQLSRYEATRKKLIANLQASLPKWAPKEKP